PILIKLSVTRIANQHPTFTSDSWWSGRHSGEPTQMMHGSQSSENSLQLGLVTTLRRASSPRGSSTTRKDQHAEPQPSVSPVTALVFRPGKTWIQRPNEAPL